MAKILVADDQTDLLEMIRTTLGMSGHEVIAVADGELALRAAAEFGPDLIIVDAHMPGLSGPEVCARLQAEAGLRGAPILLISGMASTEEIQAALEAGALEYLRKPFELSHLIERVDALLTEA